MRVPVRILVVMFVMGVAACGTQDTSGTSAGTESPARTGAFEYSSDGVTTRGRIHLPESFERGSDLPTIYLIDFTDQHFEVALDEFETVIDSVKQIDGLNALVATLAKASDAAPTTAP